MNAPAAAPAERLPQTVFGLAWLHTKPQQLYVLFIVLLSMPTYYMSLDLPKQIVNGPIQGKGFEDGATQKFLPISFDVPNWLSSSGTLDLFGGLDLDRLSTLMALSGVFLALVIVNGLFKFYINTYKGRLGERMLRRLRFDLVDRVLRFPMGHFKRVKPAEVATMVKDEVEPIGGFIGDAFVTPMLLGGQAVTAMVFIMAQNMLLGLIAAGIIAVQALVIPKMRRYQIELGRQRQLTARVLAGRIAEIVDGIGAVHVNDTSHYERADIAARLGRIFKIRFDLYQWKFFVKFLNNFLAQVTPFLFYAVGGYFAINGQLDIGQLVAVIAAYKDLPGPIKELIDWDQQRLDVQVKYTQVVEQFNVDNMLDRGIQKVVLEKVEPLSGSIRLSGVSVTDDAGGGLIQQLSAQIGFDEHVAVVGGPNSGADYLGEAIARLVPLTAGRVSINDQQLQDVPEAVTGRRLSYVPAESPLVQGSVSDNLLYGLKHVPLRAATYDEAGQRQRAWDEHEAKRSGNTALDFNADWIDYEAAGADGPEALRERLKEVLAIVELDEDLLTLGLRGTIDPMTNETLEALAVEIMKARHAVRERLGDKDYSGLVEVFDPERYADQATIGENLLFGTPDGLTFSQAMLGSHAYMRELLTSLGLDQTFFDMGREIASTAIELFADLPPDHPFFEQLSFMAADEIPEYQAALNRSQGQSFDTVSEEDRQRFMRLPFSYIEPRHRMGLLDDAMKGKLMEARQKFREGLPEELKSAIEFYDPEAYNRNASIQDNILFGRIAYGVAGGAQKVLKLVREILDAQKLNDDILGVGLDFQVGTGGKRLSHGQRQKLSLARALLRRSDLSIINKALSALDRSSQHSIMKKVLASASEEGAKRGILWILSTPGMASEFERVLVMDGGRLVETGTPKELSSKEGVFAKLVA
ncbi:MAG: ABC transporter transmembrane domain-containing protein [Parvibaculaceae bacterium]